MVDGGERLGGWKPGTLANSPLVTEFGCGVTPDPDQNLIAVCDTIPNGA